MEHDCSQLFSQPAPGTELSLPQTTSFWNLSYRAELCTCELAQAGQGWKGRFPTPMAMGGTSWARAVGHFGVKNAHGKRGRHSWVNSYQWQLRNNNIDEHHLSFFFDQEKTRRRARGYLSENATDVLISLMACILLQRILGLSFGMKAGLNLQYS